MDGGEKPGMHPDPAHEWNTNPEKFIMAEDDEDKYWSISNMKSSAPYLQMA